jgi:hypothetical protein
MRFLVDECTGPAVASWLRDQNHDAPCGKGHILWFLAFERLRLLNL